MIQDANYNVPGVVDQSGVLAERYQYTPYGQRQVYFDAETNDVGCHALTLSAVRLYDEATGLDLPYALCDAGHQGLLHDEESGLVYNRARALSPKLGRFTQRDPLEYIDGTNLCVYQRSAPLRRLDPIGAFCGDCQPPAPGQPNQYRPRITAVTVTPGASNPANLGVGGTVLTAAQALSQLSGVVNVSTLPIPTDEAGDAIDRFKDAIRSRDGFGVFIGVEYDSCDCCTNWFRDDAFEFKAHFRWYQCTSGSAGGQGIYGGQNGDPTPTAANLRECIQDALK